MNGAEFKVLRESLGLSLAWLAQRWGLESERGPKRWQERNEPIPEARAADMEQLAAIADGLVEWQLTELLTDAAGDRRLLVPRVDADSPDEFPASFYRAVAARVSWELEGRLKIEYRAGISDAFGLSLGEIATIAEPATAAA